MVKDRVKAMFSFRIRVVVKDRVKASLGSELELWLTIELELGFELWRGLV